MHLPQRDPDVAKKYWKNARQYLAVKGNCICLLCISSFLQQIIEVVKCLQALHTHFTANQTASWTLSEKDNKESNRFNIEKRKGIPHQDKTNNIGMLCKLAKK